ncbi:DNA binding domain-containing protein, excisionase family [Kytococcus aerolatus]|uniref:DNA binding domain-containing protein, excisionase family n=1 Tax=Kytococcus aerolatus TaxID=592308 RepID=A0A212T8N7_9MICO|nr:helix-turn-helix domain-containing protein [Kytococcus aerolatus]SNC62423.1 DNA binding domain-containing protein, excisionase family [Kytococcus aerolatus]
MGYSPPPSSDLTHYITLQEVVSLGYGAYQTLREWIADGRLPAVKIGSRIKVLRTDLDGTAEGVTGH